MMNETLAGAGVLAGLAYLNAKGQISNDIGTLMTGIKATRDVKKISRQSQGVRDLCLALTLF